MSPSGSDRFDSLYDLGQTVIEAVPIEERDRFRYWRGAHMGKIALNFDRGCQTLTASADGTAHFADDYDSALGFAQNVFAGISRMQQFSDTERTDLSSRSGHELYAELPSIVFALDESFNELVLPKAIATVGIGYGYILDRYIRPDMIDPYSRAKIETLLAK